MKIEFNTDPANQRVYTGWECAFASCEGYFDYPALESKTKPRAMKDGSMTKAKFEVTFVMDRESEGFKTFESQMKDLSKTIGQEYNKIARGAKIDVNSIEPFKDGDAKKSPADEETGYEGCAYLVARHNDKPEVLGVPDGEAIEAGDRGRVVLRPHFGPTGMSYYLLTVKRLGKGERKFPKLVAQRSYGSLLDDDSEDAKHVFSNAPKNGSQKGKANAVNLLNS